MNIFTKRNALVGFLTLKAVSRRGPFRRKRQGWSAWKIGTLVVLGVLSAGVLAVVGAALLRRQREPEQIEGFVVSGEDDTPLAGAFAEATPEPFPASA